MFTIPDDILAIERLGRPRLYRIRQLTIRLFNIALVSLAAFTIVGSVGCAIKLTLLQ